MGENATRRTLEAWLRGRSELNDARARALIKALGPASGQALLSRLTSEDSVSADALTRLRAFDPTWFLAENPGLPTRKLDAYRSTKPLGEPADAPTQSRAPSAELSEGQLIGPCRVLSELGRGAMGAVYLCHHTGLDKEVAVKVLPAHLALSSPDHAQRFLREARLAAQLDHPNITSVLDCGQDPESGLNYIVQEYVGGGTLAARLESGPLEEPEALAILSQLARAIESASAKSIVHRDIKPANVLFTLDGIVKLADLGLAKQLDTAQPTVTLSHTGIGTPVYMSPEQIKDAKRVDVRADLYSLGATFYHMLTGSPPYRGKTVYEVLNQVLNEPPPEIPGTTSVSMATRQLCRRLLAKDPDQRYPTAKALLDELEALDRQPARSAARQAPSTAPQASPRPKIWPLGLAIAVVAASLPMLLAAMLSDDGKQAEGPDSSQREANIRPAPPLEVSVEVEIEEPLPSSQELMRTPMAAFLRSIRSLRDGIVICFDGPLNDSGQLLDQSPARAPPALLRHDVRTGKDAFRESLLLAGGWARFESSSAPTKSVALRFKARPSAPDDTSFCFFAQGRKKDRGAFLLGLARGRPFDHWPKLESRVWLSSWGDDAVLARPVNEGWHSVIAVIDGANSSLWLDGEAGDVFRCRVGSDAPSEASPQPFDLQALSTQSGDAISFGSFEHSKGILAPFQGQLADVIVWSRALSLEERRKVSELYQTKAHVVPLLAARIDQR